MATNHVGMLPGVWTSMMFGVLCVFQCRAAGIGCAILGDHAESCSQLVFCALLRAAAACWPLLPLSVVLLRLLVAAC